MIQVDFSGQFLDDDGNVWKNRSGEVEALSKALAKSLMTKRGEIKLRKAVGWGRALTKTGILSLDDSDFKDLQSYIENQADFTPTYSVQLLEAMDESKEKSE